MLLTYQIYECRPERGVRTVVGAEGLEDALVVLVDVVAGGDDVEQEPHQHDGRVGASNPDGAKGVDAKYDDHNHNGDANHCSLQTHTKSL